MKKLHLLILTGIAALGMMFTAGETAQAACDSCVSHALPTTSGSFTTAYYAPAAPVAQTAFYAPTATAYTSYYRPRWWRRWWRAPRTVVVPTTVARTAYFAPTVAAAPACSTCVAPAPACSTCTTQVSYKPVTAYKTQVVNQPVTTMRASTVIDGCTGCARTVMRPVTTWVQTVQRVPTTVYQPVTSTSCAPACSVPTCGPSCTGCATCAAGPATIQATPAVPQQNVPTEADQKPELRMKPLPDKETDDAAEKAHKANTRGNDFPRLTDPNDRTAQVRRSPVRTASFEQTAPPKKRVTYRQVGEGGWYSAK